MAERTGEEVPNSWGVDSSGLETEDPTAIIQGGGLLPLGGSERTGISSQFAWILKNRFNSKLFAGGYKGFGLGMLVEIFCGILGDGSWGPNVRKWMSTETEANLVY